VGWAKGQGLAARGGVQLGQARGNHLQGKLHGSLSSSMVWYHRRMTDESSPCFSSEIAAHYDEGIEQPRLDRRIERELSRMGVSAHLLALARRPIE